MSNANISDEEILRLWKSPLFEGSFFGAKKFVLFLKTNLNLDIPESRVLRVISQDPIFITHQRRREKIIHRHFYLTHVGQVVQADLGYMFSRNNYKFILLVVDCYSNRVFTKALKNKKSPTVALALQEIFNKFKVPIEKFETDQ